jgi:hypothetical protein
MALPGSLRSGGDAMRAYRVWLSLGFSEWKGEPRAIEILKASRNDPDVGTYITNTLKRLGQ